MLSQPWEEELRPLSLLHPLLYLLAVPTREALSKGNLVTNWPLLCLALLTEVIWEAILPNTPPNISPKL